MIIRFWLPYSIFQENKTCSVLDEAQSGFIINRHISNNIHLVLDILDYSSLVSDDSFVLFFFRFL